MTLLPAVRGFKNMSSILRYIVLQKKRPNYPILPYTYAYDYPVSYTHTHTFDNFFKGGTVPLMLDVLRLSPFYLLQA